MKKTLLRWYFYRRREKLYKNLANRFIIDGDYNAKHPD